jgi:hypothetical protein
MVNVRLIDARVSTDVSESMPHNHYAGFMADDGFGFAQDNFHEAWVLLGFCGEINGLLRGCDGRERYQATFRLRNDLLSDDDHVAVFKRLSIVAKLVCYQVCQVVALVDHREPFDR